MTKRQRLLLVLAIVAGALLVVAVLGALFGRAALTGPIASVTFSQNQAVPDYDGTEYTITDDARLAELADLFEKHNTIPELVSATNLGNCPGSVTTDTQITFASGRVAHMQLNNCGDGEGVYGDFVDEATDLLTSWKDSR